MPPLSKMTLCELREITSKARVRRDAPLRARRPRRATTPAMPDLKYRIMRVGRAEAHMTLADVADWWGLPAYVVLDWVREGRLPQPVVEGRWSTRAIRTHTMWGRSQRENAKRRKFALTASTTEANVIQMETQKPH